MGTEVMRPHDVLGERFRYPPTSFHRRKNINGAGNLTNLIVNRKPNHHHHNAAAGGGHKKTSPRSDKKKIAAAADQGGAKKSNHGGSGEARRKDDGVKQVTLLRRGESLDSLTAKINAGNPNPNPKLRSPKHKPVDDLAICGTGRIGPDSPEMVLKQIRLAAPPPPPLDMYAGSAFSMSPSPRSVPLPSFFSKKHQIDGSSNIKPIDDSATRDLRRLLRLD